MGQEKVKMWTVCVLVLASLFTAPIPGTAAPEDEKDIEISEVFVSNVSPSFAVVSFFTDIPARGMVKYGTDPERLNMTAEDTSLRSTGLVYAKLFDLDQDQRYYFSVYAYRESLVGFDDNGGAFYSFKTSMPSYTTPYAVTGNVMHVENGSYVPVQGAVAFFYVTHGNQRTMLQSNVTSNYFGEFSFNTGNLKLPSGKGYDVQKGDNIVVEVDAGPLGTGKNTTEYRGTNVNVGTIVVDNKGSGLEDPDEYPEGEQSSAMELSSFSFYIFIILAIIVIGILLKGYSYAKESKER